ncbi:MFS transporter [Phreatobacter stygius]|uniref:MFS transporter n=1 Tax=Phreatobacter stygius TaxID=1940610 RepID=A0A4D7BHA1_9HYPH|nr:MFS transporter [Phreatobacter stygius]QCI67177.1 MFS transporter [Phreatobacter stygius]
MQTFLALSLAYIISIFFRLFLSVLATRIMADMRIGATELAVMSSSWFVTFAVMQLPVGWALDRFGPRRTVLPLMLVGAVGVCLFPFAPNAILGSLAMALIGIGCSPVYMSAVYVFARNHPPAQFGLLASLLIGIGSIGNFVGTVPLALLADGFGWRATMMMLGVLYGVAFALAAVFLKDPPRIDGKADSGIFSGLGAIVSTRLFWLLVPIVFFSYAVAVALRGLWIAPYLAEVIELTPAQQSNAAMLMAMAMTSSAFLFGWIENRWGQAKALVVAGNLAMAAALALLAATAVQTAVAATAIFVFIGFCGFSYTILMAHARPFFPDHLVGRGMTLLNFVFIAGVVAVQTGSGWLIDDGLGQGLDPAVTFARMHGALAAVLFVSTLVYMVAPRRPGR